MHRTIYGKQMAGPGLKGTVLFLTIVTWVLSTGCGPTFLDVGGQYMQRNNPAVAVEYFAAGLRADSGNKELWNRYVMASLLNETRLRRDIKRLQGAGRHYMSLKKLYLLYDSLARARELHRGDARPGALKDPLKRTRTLALQQVTAGFEKNMQSHWSRGDLDVLRKAMALEPEASLLKQRYAELLDAFKFYVVPRFAPGSTIKPRGVKDLVAKRLASMRMELVEPVTPASPKYNADIVLYLDRPQRFDTGWVMAGRKAFHKWVPRRDRKGRVIY